MRFSIATILFAIAMVALYFPVHSAYRLLLSNSLKESHPKYQDFVISSDLREGQSFELVSNRYRTMRKVEKDEQIYSHFEHVAEVNDWIIRTSDEFYEYTFNGRDSIGYHQFRDGKLVNHPADSFRDPYQNALTNNFKIPSVFLRFGEWPLYFFCVLFFAVAWRWLMRLIGRSSAGRSHVAANNVG